MLHALDREHDPFAARVLGPFNYPGHTGRHVGSNPHRIDAAAPLLNNATTDVSHVHRFPAHAERSGPKNTADRNTEPPPEHWCSWLLKVLALCEPPQVFP